MQLKILCVVNMITHIEGGGGGTRCMMFITLMSQSDFIMFYQYCLTWVFLPSEHVVF